MSPLKKIMFYAIGGALIVLSLVIVFKENGLLDLKEKKGRLADIVKENDKLREQNKELFSEVKRLKNDDAYLEHVARKEMGMIKEDEIVIQFHSDKKKQ